MQHESAVRSIASTQSGDYTELLKPDSRIVLTTKKRVKYVGWVVKVSQDSILVKLQDSRNTFSFERGIIDSLLVI